MARSFRTPGSSGQTGKIPDCLAGSAGDSDRSRGRWRRVKPNAPRRAAASAAISFGVYVSSSGPPRDRTSVTCRKSRLPASPGQVRSERAQPRAGRRLQAAWRPGGLAAPTVLIAEAFIHLVLAQAHLADLGGAAKTQPQHLPDEPCQVAGPSASSRHSGAGRRRISPAFSANIAAHGHRHVRRNAQILDGISECRLLKLGLSMADSAQVPRRAKHASAPLAPLFCAHDNLELSSPGNAPGTLSGGRRQALSAACPPSCRRLRVPQLEAWRRGERHGFLRTRWESRDSKGFEGSMTGIDKGTIGRCDASANRELTQRLPTAQRAEERAPLARHRHRGWRASARIAQSRTCPTTSHFGALGGSDAIPAPSHRRRGATLEGATRRLGWLW